MERTQKFKVAGVDGCRAGWCFAIVSVTCNSNISANSVTCKVVALSTAGTFEAVLSALEQCELICIDMPIGLSSLKERTCDLAARKLLGKKRSASIFPAPIRPSLAARDYETAAGIYLNLTGKKPSRQTFALFEKVRQVDSLMTPSLQQRVREIHPELCFWALNGCKALRHSKKTVPGLVQRHILLQSVLSDVDTILAKGPATGYKIDDAFDAIAAAWAAAQSTLGMAFTLPDKPELDSKGLKMEILCPQPPCRKHTSYKEWTLQTRQSNMGNSKHLNRSDKLENYATDANRGNR